MWLDVGSSRLSSICCNFLITSLGAQHVVAQEDGIKVVVESPKVFFKKKYLLFIYFGPREMQPSVLYFIICVAPAPQTWTGCCSIGLMLTKRNFSSSQLKHYCRLACATGDIVGISEMPADVWHLYLLSLSEREEQKKKQHTFLTVEEALERSVGKLAPLWWLFSGDLVSQNAVFVLEMIDTDLDDIKKWNGGKLSSWF